MRTYYFFIFCLVIHTAVEAQPVPIPFISLPPSIDGSADDWEKIPPYRHQNSRLKVFSYNQSEVKLAYDESFLYGLFTIFDKHFIRLAQDESGSKRLNFNDAVELFIDTHNDSREKMDSGDYQILADIAGKTTVFRGGDRFLMQIDEARVPKDTVTQNFVLDVAVKLFGTVNQTQDTDSLYVVELRIPWAALGIKPRENLSLKLDICVDDADSLLDIRPLPDSAMIPGYGFENWQGDTDFGFPSRWRKAILTGHRPQTDSSLWLLSVGLLVPAGVWLGYRFWKEKKQTTALTFRTPAAPIATRHPQIEKATVFVNQNMESDLSPAVLAEALAMSQRQLQRLFREELDTTPNAFISQQKMLFARHLLQTTSLNISEAAYAVGFSDPAYFARVFKKQFGHNPSDV